MSVPVELKCLKTGSSPIFTKRGEVVTAPLAHSTFYLGATASNNVAVNIIPPLPNKKFIITAMIISGDRSIGANGAVTDIFENSVGPTDGTVTKQIIQEEIAKQTRMVATGLYIIVNAGRWINIKSDDVIVRANVAGYYVDELEEN